jgi:hypothetical protein
MESKCGCHDSAFEMFDLNCLVAVPSMVTEIAIVVRVFGLSAISSKVTCVPYGTNYFPCSTFGQSAFSDVLMFSYD